MTLQGKKIVAIDDTKAILTFLEIFLEGQGTDFYKASTAESGLDTCKIVAPDLVVLDLGLPDKDGLNLLPDI